MNLASDQKLDIPLLGMDQGTLESAKKSFEASQGIKGGLTGQEIEMAGKSIMGISSNAMSSEIWSSREKFQLIADVFEEELRKTSQRISLSQITLIVNELIRLEKSKPQEVQLNVSQGTSLILQLLKTSKTGIEEKEWVENVLEQLRTIEQED